MKINTLYLFILFLSFIWVSFIFFKQIQLKDNFLASTPVSSIASILEGDLMTCCNFEVKSKALLSSRFNSLAQLKTIVSINYDMDYSSMDSSACLYSVVNLCYKSSGETIFRTMTSGISQNEILKLQKAGYFEGARFVFRDPNIIRLRGDLEKAYILARRKLELFGPGDMAFYDLAEASFRNINTPNLAFKNTRDSSEKGYINTFNHITAQAIITSFFSEYLADLIGDLHERNNMPEITSGRFRPNQLVDSLNSPEDNYIDILNNEIGQKIGLELQRKYKLTENSICNTVFLANYLNDIQSYYMWTFEIGMDNFRPTDEVVIRISNKINALLKRS